MSLLQRWRSDLSGAAMEEQCRADLGDGEEAMEESVRRETRRGKRRRTTGEKARRERRRGKSRREGKFGAEGRIGSVFPKCVNFRS